MANLPRVSLKLLINTQTKKVMFAEAGKDLVDFLFSILSLPVAKVISLVHNHGMVGSLGNLYESVENLNETYIQPNQTKNNILAPRPHTASSGVPLLGIEITPAPRRCYFRCGNCHKYVSNDMRATCPDCKTWKMNSPITYVAPPAPEQQYVSGEGFVKGVVTYMIMDNLAVEPMSTITSIAMLNKFNVKDVGAMEEKVVDFGMNEAVKLLKASLETKNVLTGVFLNKSTNIIVDLGS